MKNKIAGGIMLLAGSIAAVICLINNTNIDTMLLSVFFSMLIFMIIGFTVQSIVEKMNKDAEERLAIEAEERRKAEAEEKARKEEEERLAREEELLKQQARNEEDNINDILAAGISAKSNGNNYRF